MGKFIKRVCTECGGPLSVQRRGRGHSCRTDGCPIQKLFFDKDGNVIKILFSSEPKSAPMATDQVRIMAEVMIT